MEGVPDAEVLDGHLMTQFQPEAITALLEGMSVANTRIDIAAHFFSPSGAIECEADGAPGTTPAEGTLLGSTALGPSPL